MGEPRAVTWYVVPAGTVGKACRAANCQRTIYFIDSPKNNGKQVPVDCDVEGGVEPTASTAGSGVNHYTTCGNPRMFHKPKPPAREQQALPPRPAKPRACIACGCTETNACLLTPEEAGINRPMQLDDEGGESFVGCSWLSLDPPICNAPKCRKVFDELPLAKRIPRSTDLEERAHG